MKRTVKKSSREKRRTGPSVSAFERRQMEAELREAEERIALSALDTLSAHIAILDADGKILAVNKAWREFGRDKRERLDRRGVGENYFACGQSTAMNGAFSKFSDGVNEM